MNYAEKATTTSHAPPDPHPLLLEQCRSPEEVTLLQEEVQLSDHSRSCHLTDSPLQCMIMDVEVDKAKAVYLNKKTSLPRSSGLPVKDLISETSVL
jgi:hypothetical protein